MLYSGCNGFRLDVALSYQSPFLQDPSLRNRPCSVLLGRGNGCNSRTRQISSRPSDLAPFPTVRCPVDKGGCEERFVVGGEGVEE